MENKSLKGHITYKTFVFFPTPTHACQFLLRPTIPAVLL